MPDSKPEYTTEWSWMRKLKAEMIEQLAQGHANNKPAELVAHSCSDFAIKGILAICKELGILFPFHLFSERICIRSSIYV